MASPAVEEKYVVGGNSRAVFELRFWPKFSGSGEALGGVVSESFAVIYRFFDDILCPLGDR